MNEEMALKEREKLRKRVVNALRITEPYGSRGPKTLAARRSLEEWLTTGLYPQPGYLAMTTPAEACRWLEYVVRSEQGQRRLEGIRSKARDQEEGITYD